MMESPLLKPLSLGYGQGLSEFVIAIDRIIFQLKDVDWVHQLLTEYCSKLDNMPHTCP